MCATWVPQIIGAVPEIQHGESRVTTEGVYSPNVAMSPNCPNLALNICFLKNAQVDPEYSDLKFSQLSDDSKH